MNSELGDENLAGLKDFEQKAHKGKDWSTPMLLIQEDLREIE